MQCNEIRNHIAEYLTEELERATQDELARHLKECPACRAELEEMTDLWVKIGSIPAGEPASPDLDIRLRAAAEAYTQDFQQAAWKERVWKQGLALAAAAAIVLAVLIGMWWRAGAAAVLESGGSQRVGYGETVRANTGAGSVLVLTDGSRVEMRSQSQLVLEHAADGVRIRLNRGGVIVNAAKQHGHLYVQTKDVTVSVVGTVFLVNAEEAGSRVAVIEGEVRVQQEGATEKKLRPGEQASTNPLMESQTVKEEISWSKNAVEHLALLEQSEVISAVRQNSTEPRLAFEEASIRQSNPAPADGGGGRGGPDPGNPCVGGSVQIDPSRFIANRMSLYKLIRLAYGKGNCTAEEMLTAGSGIKSGLDPLYGGPGWIRSDQFDIQALIPPGTFSVKPQLDDAKLQVMLQTLLADRFKVVLRRDSREVPDYVLTLGKSGPKLTPAKDGDIVTWRSGYRFNKDKNGEIVGSLNGVKAPMSELVYSLQEVTGRPVMNQTGITGVFNYRVEYTPLDNGLAAALGIAMTGSPSYPSLFTALEEQLGLKLATGKTYLEVLVIERVEKPSEN